MVNKVIVDIRNIIQLCLVVVVLVLKYKINDPPNHYPWKVYYNPIYNFRRNLKFWYLKKIETLNISRTWDFDIEDIFDIQSKFEILNSEENCAILIIEGNRDFDIRRKLTLR